MTWSRALLYVAIWAILSAYYVAFERPATSASRPPKATDERLLSLRADAITELRFDAHGLTLQCARSAGQWRVVEPPDVPIPSDLIAALVTSLTELVPVDVVSRGEAHTAGEFGLADPTAHLIVIAGSERTGLQLGNRNPSQTAVYARRDGVDEIVLVGLNVQYYIDLIMDALRRHPA